VSSRRVVSGTASSCTRTGIRCASRSQVKVGSMVAGHTATVTILSPAD
jgi:hypothetical protein